MSWNILDSACCCRDLHTVLDCNVYTVSVMSLSISLLVLTMLKELFG